VEIVAPSRLAWDRSKALYIKGDLLRATGYVDVRVTGPVSESKEGAIGDSMADLFAATSEVLGDEWKEFCIARCLLMEQGSLPASSCAVCS
jgi:hypothetical protein